MTGPAQTVGLLGGMFDPPHLGHRAVLEHASAHGALRMPMLVLVSGVPPHRPAPVAAAQDRFAMARAAFADLDFVDVSDLEIARSSRGGAGYMIDSVHELMALRPSTTFELVVGEDQAAGLRSWHRWQELLEAVSLCVVTRTGEARDIDRLVEPIASFTRTRVVAMPRVDAASSTIRQLIADGRIDDARPFVEPAVADMLERVYVDSGLLVGSPHSEPVEPGQFGAAAPLHPRSG